MAVQFQDFSFNAKAQINEKTIAWLYETANEIASQAQRNCQYDDESGGKQLKGSYASQVDEGKGEARIGSPLESAYWEEWGTGEYAAHGDGRRGWWIYIPGQASMGGGQTYKTKEEAEAMAAMIRAAYDKEAIVTNGRKPNYTLEKAFKKTKAKAIARLESLMKEMDK
jgi:hypothetical protein